MKIQGWRQRMQQRARGKISSLPESMWVYVGTLDRPHEAKDYMISHVCVESEIPWLTIRDDLPRRRSDEELIYAAAGLDLSEDKD